VTFDLDMNCHLWNTDDGGWCLSLWNTHTASVSFVPDPKVTSGSLNASDLAWVTKHLTTCHTHVKGHLRPERHLESLCTSWTGDRSLVLYWYQALILLVLGSGLWHVFGKWKPKLISKIQKNAQIWAVMAVLRSTEIFVLGYGERCLVYGYLRIGLRRSLIWIRKYLYWATECARGNTDIYVLGAKGLKLIISPISNRDHNITKFREILDSVM